jgi:hypothetical protein
LAAGAGFVAAAFGGHGGEVAKAVAAAAAAGGAAGALGSVVSGAVHYPRNADYDVYRSDVPSPFPPGVLRPPR